MKKNLTYLLILGIFLLSFTSCTKSTEKETEAPLDDINSLLNKYPSASTTEKSAEGSANTTTTPIFDAENNTSKTELATSQNENITSNQENNTSKTQQVTSGTEPHTSTPVKEPETTISAGIQWKLNGSVLTIYGSGNMNGTPWYNKRASVTKAVIENGVANIGDSAFAECIQMTELQMPNSVKSIGYKAFYKCSSLSAINISSNAGYLDDFAFFNCSSLTNVTIPGSVKTIGSNCFENCSLISSISIKEGVTTIKANAFKGCSSLDSMEIPASVTNIDDSAFGTESPVIYGPSGSYIQNYAKTHHFTFVVKD